MVTSIDEEKGAKTLRLYKALALLLVSIFSLALMGEGSAQAAFMLQDDVEVLKEEGENNEDEGGESRGTFCDNPDKEHPVAAGIASQYSASYGEVMGWFCDGNGLGSIGLALETAAAHGGSAGELLGEAGEKGWGQVWQELGLIGRPDDAGPPNDEDGDGIPDFAGPPNDEDGDGIPDFAGRPECAGPPDERPGHCEKEARGPDECTGPPDERPEHCQLEERGPGECTGPPDERPEHCEKEERGPGECTGPTDDRPEHCELEERGPGECTGPPDDRPEHCQLQERGLGECVGPPGDRPEHCEKEEQGPPDDADNGDGD